MENNRKSIRINSDTKYLPVVDSYLKSIFKELGLPQHLYNKYYLCVSEAVTNSITHGNKNNDKKWVEIKSIIKRRHIKFIVKDEGEGFDPNDLQDPTKKANIKKEKGRGIFIIKSLSKGIKFRKKGSVVEFKLKLSGKNIVSPGGYGKV